MSVAPRHPRQAPRRQQRCLRGQAGFTLIELMIGLILLGILLAFSFPAFTALLNSGSQTASGSSSQTQSASVAQQMDADIRAISGAGALGTVDNLDNMLASLDEGNPAKKGILRAGRRVLEMNADVAGAADDFETVRWELFINNGRCPGDAAENWCISRSINGNAINVQEIVSAGGGLFPNSADCAGSSEPWLFCYRYATVPTYDFRNAAWTPTACRQSWGDAGDPAWGFGQSPNAPGASVAWNSATITKQHFAGTVGTFTMSPLDRITTVRSAAAAGSQTGGRIRNDMTTRETDIVKRNSIEYMTALMCGARLP